MAQLHSYLAKDPYISWKGGLKTPFPLAYTNQSIQINKLKQGLIEYTEQPLIS